MVGMEWLKGGDTDYECAAKRLQNCQYYGFCNIRRSIYLECDDWDLSDRTVETALLAYFLLGGYDEEIS